MKWHHALARSLGYELLNAKKHQPTVESHLEILLKRLEIEVVIDVGANKGQYGKLLRQIGFGGSIFSFEPLSSCRKSLELASRGDLLWQVFGFALGDTNSEQTIHVAEASEFSSMLHPNANAAELYAEKTPIRHTEQISVRRLDDLMCKELASVVGKATLLKMDTQGFDLRVLAGGQEFLKGVTALQSEISVLPLYEGMPDYMESLATFRSAGFEPTGLFPVSRNPDTLQLIELDCVMRRVAI